MDTGIVNGLAYAQRKRLVNMNMMRAYPGDKAAAVYERRRAAEVLEESRKYDIVIDLHNLHQYGDATGVISLERGVTPSVLGFLGSLSINNLVVDDSIGMHPHLDNAFILESSAALLGDDERLRHGLEALANDLHPPQKIASSFT